MKRPNRESALEPLRCARLFCEEEGGPATAARRQDYYRRAVVVRGAFAQALAEADEADQIPVVATKSDGSTNNNRQPKRRHPFRDTAWAVCAQAWPAARAKTHQNHCVCACCCCCRRRRLLPTLP